MVRISIKYSEQKDNQIIENKSETLLYIEFK